jgi:broad specificity phosphatase PhoE
VPTMTVYLVRHASAGVRNNRDPADPHRGIDPTGHLQADKLSEWLRHEPVSRIVSSPLERCVQTVQPLAKQLRLEVETDERLVEGTPVDLAWELLVEVAAGTTVLCSHGDVIPDLVRRAQGRGMLVPGKSGCSKGSVWQLQHWDGERFATGLYTPVKA